jgi:hypothetical protein
MWRSTENASTQLNWSSSMAWRCLLSQRNQEESLFGIALLLLGKPIEPKVGRM